MLSRTAVKVTWTPTDTLVLPESVGTLIRKNRKAIYFDTMREAERFICRYLVARTSYKTESPWRS